MKLYEIDERLRALLNTETGEISEDFTQEEFEALQMAKEEKITNIAYLIRNEEADIEVLDKTVADLLDRLEKKSSKVKKLKALAAYYLEDGQTIKTPYFSVYRKVSQATEIEDKNLIPKEFMKPTTTYSPNKTAIKEAIEKGETVPGAKIVTNYSTVIR